jgi:hypothetical protein
MVIVQRQFHAIVSGFGVKPGNCAILIGGGCVNAGAFQHTSVEFFPFWVYFLDAKNVVKNNAGF